jgi:hypothetical protein
MNQTQIFTMAPTTYFAPLKRWYMQRKLNTFQRCADVELKIAKQHQANAKYFEKQAMLIKADLK